MPRFGIFDITPIGLVTAASGIISLAAMWWLLPSDKPVNGTGGAADAHQYLTELILQDGDELIGQRVGAFKGLPRSGRIVGVRRSEEHTSELQSLMRSSYAVFCLKQTNECDISTRDS